MEQHLCRPNHLYHPPFRHVWVLLIQVTLSKEIIRDALPFRLSAVCGITLRG